MLTFKELRDKIMGGKTITSEDAFVAENEIEWLTNYIKEKIMSAQAKRKQAKYRKSAAGKKSAKMFKKKSSRAGYKVDKAKSRSMKKARAKSGISSEYIHGEEK